MRKLWKKFLDKLLNYRRGQLIVLIGYDMADVLRHRWGQYKEVKLFDKQYDDDRAVEEVIRKYLPLPYEACLTPEMDVRVAEQVRTDHGSLAELIETINTGGTKH